MSKLVKIKKYIRKYDETIFRTWKRYLACDNYGYIKTEYMREETLMEDVYTSGKKRNLGNKN
jgi:hypothetical protein